jgi:hypothetical protein
MRRVTEISIVTTIVTEPMRQNLKKTLAEVISVTPALSVPWEIGAVINKF